MSSIKSIVCFGNINHLINNSSFLENITFKNCSVCKDGFVITKTGDKLKNLKYLDLDDNADITDASIINLTKGCHNLETIQVGSCNKLTDSCLFGIAGNCPKLKIIRFDYYYEKFTIVGITELRAKCSQIRIAKLHSCGRLYYDDEKYVYNYE